MTSHLSLFLIVIVLLTGSPSVGQIQTKPREKRAAFEKVMALDREAKAALDREKASGKTRTGPAAEDRQKAYRAAANELDKYIPKWIPDVSSVEYLRELYRQATYLEFADLNSEAHALYSQCLSHPQITAPGAIFNNHKLVDLLPTRLAETVTPVPISVHHISEGSSTSERGETTTSAHGENTGATKYPGSSSPAESGSSAATGSSAISIPAQSSQSSSPSNTSGRPPF